jgi:hypothetical protein
MHRPASSLSFAALPLALAFPIALFVACSDSAVGAVTTPPVADAAPVEAATEDVTPPSDAAPDAAVRSPISSSTKTTAEAETHLAVAPDGRVLVAWNGFGPKFGTGYAFSPDRGATFAAAELIAGNLGDPIVASGSDSSLYIGYVDGTCNGGTCTNGHVYVRKAPPGSSTFGAAIDVSEGNPAHFYDKPWLMRTGTGALVTIFAQREGNYPTNLDAIVAARSTDGVAWTRSMVVPIQPMGTLAGIPHACASRSGGRVWTVFVDSSSAVGGTLRWSDDGGATWPTTNRGQTFSLPSETAEVQSYDYRCAGEGNDVWVMYGLGAGPGTDDAISPLRAIVVAHSGDAGITFDRRTTIELTGALYLRPELVVEAGGALNLMMYRGAKANDPMGRVERLRSTDGGKTFAAPVVELDPTLFDPSRSTPTWIGDYSGLVADGTDILMSYVANAGGHSHVAFTKRPLP